MREITVKKEKRFIPHYKRARAAYKDQDPMAEFARLVKILKGKTKPVVFNDKDYRQNCIVKMQYSNNIKAHKLQLEQYLVREGTERDGAAAALFGSDLQLYRQNMTEKNFRIFLSPQSNEVDLKMLTMNFVNRLETQTGYKLHWQAACHYDTAQPHSHILINGVDQNNMAVSFPRDVVKTFMRENARDLCTVQLGLRSELDIQENDPFIKEMKKLVKDDPLPSMEKNRN